MTLSICLWLQPLINSLGASEMLGYILLALACYYLVIVMKPWDLN
jgi:hypothetical protein